MTPLRTWSAVQVAGLLLTAWPHLQDLTNEMPWGDSVVCELLNTAFSCTLGHGKSPSYMTSHILLIPEFCPGGQRQRLTLNKSTLLV